MATCRTCEFCYPCYGCSEEKMPLDHITTDHGCAEHKPRETLLLVDVLATALSQCLHYVQLGNAQVLYEARQALARHKEEVGDAEETE